MKQTLLALALIISLISKADEGMWLPQLLNALNIKDMKKNGLKLTAEQIYSVNKSSLKDAIVQFGGGCTAEIVSDQGLILTNHHCGYSAIAYHSTVEKDYLTNGFWAMNKNEEVYTPNLNATIKRNYSYKHRIEKRFYNKSKYQIIRKRSHCRNTLRIIYQAIFLW